MSVSFAAMNRIIEKEAAENADYRRVLERRGKCTLSDGRTLPDDELLEKLRSLDLHLTREWLASKINAVGSAEVLARSIYHSPHYDIPEDEQDWVWIALCCLWERWFPDRPSFEMLDDWMQAGYDAYEKNRPLEAAELWEKTWLGLRHWMDVLEHESLDDLDEEFVGIQSVFNWVSDYSSALWQAGLSGSQFVEQRAAFCREALGLFERSTNFRDHIGNFRSDLAESLADLEGIDTADRCYGEWLAENPRWGWGWIHWADLYGFRSVGRQENHARAEEILLRGLAVPNVEDRRWLCQRLHSLYEEQGRDDDAAALRTRFPEDCPKPRSERRGATAPASRGTAAQRAPRQSLDMLRNLLEADYGNYLPEQTLREAQARRDEIVPLLTDLLRDATEAARLGEKRIGRGHFFALYLLAEFRAKQALPDILDAISLPDDGPFDLFGDAITNDLCRMLAVLADDRLDVIDSLIANRAVNQFVRSAAAEAHLNFVRDGHMSRGDAVRRLKTHLENRLADEDADGVDLVVTQLLRYSPAEAIEQIDEAFRRNLVGGWVTAGDLSASLAEGDERFLRELERCPPTGIEDTVEELRSWRAFQPRNDDRSTKRDAARDDQYPDEQRASDGGHGGGRIAPPHFHHDPALLVPGDPPTADRETITIRNSGPRVGRNDPCHCGSGRKFKKCCGDR